MQTNHEQVISYIQAKTRERLSEYDRNMVSTTIEAVEAIQRAKLAESLGPIHEVPKPKKSIFRTWPVWCLAAGFIAGISILVLIGVYFLQL
jgi:hypothetical protein